LILSGTAGIYRIEKYVVVERHRHRFTGFASGAASP